MGRHVRLSGRCCDLVLWRVAFLKQKKGYIARRAPSLWPLRSLVVSSRPLVAAGRGPSMGLLRRLCRIGPLARRILKQKGYIARRAPFIVAVALVGARLELQELCGPWAVLLNNSASDYGWTVGASLSLIPPSVA